MSTLNFALQDWVELIIILHLKCDAHLLAQWGHRTKHSENVKKYDCTNIDKIVKVFKCIAFCQWMLEEENSKINKLSNNERRCSSCCAINSKCNFRLIDFFSSLQRLYKSFEMISEIASICTAVRKGGIEEEVMSKMNQGELKIIMAPLFLVRLTHQVTWIIHAKNINFYHQRCVQIEKIKCIAKFQ